jgi:periplasmic protein TonB
LLLSAILHILALGALAALAALGQEPQPKTYVVNLVPAIAAVGRPQGRASVPPPPTPPAPPAHEPAPPAPSTPALPPRPSEVKQAPPMKSAPAELPRREARATVAPPELPARRGVPDTSLPDRTLAPRPVTVPRPGDKELPAAALPRGLSSMPTPRRESASPPAPAAQATQPTQPTPPQPPSPPAPLGQAGGSMQGMGAVTLSVSDFPYAWYIQAIHRKIQERWDGRAIDGRQPEVIFEIGGNGQLRRLAIGKSSGNPAYDQLAIRAVSDANPFPPLPTGFGKPSLTVGLQFVYDPRAR